MARYAISALLVLMAASAPAFGQGAGAQVLVPTGATILPSNVFPQGPGIYLRPDGTLSASGMMHVANEREDRRESVVFVSSPGPFDAAELDVRVIDGGVALPGDFRGAVVVRADTGARLHGRTAYPTAVMLASALWAERTGVVAPWIRLGLEKQPGEIR